MNSFIEEHYNLYKDQLKGYTYITHSTLPFVKPGGHIMLINLKGQLRKGGVLLDILNTRRYTTTRFLMETPTKRYSISYTNNYIFYSETPHPPPLTKKSLRKQIEMLLTELTHK